MSFSDSVISETDHRIWFNTVTKNNIETILIAEDGANKLGMVRITPKSPNIATLSININPKFRQKGHGTEILSIAIEWIKVHSPNLIYLEANVKKENIASIKIFQKNGFKIDDENYSAFENSLNLILKLCNF
jgi:RimJ/RimL family protein N-acetyltransferase